MEIKSLNRKTIAVGILAVTMSIAAIFAIQTATAQSGNQTSTTLPQLNGSVSINNATNAFIKENVKVPFNTAAQTALDQVQNGAIISGRLSSVQGYLSYVFKVANYDAGTYKVVIVDAGNGKVLYTSNDYTLQYGGLGGGGCGHHGHFGYGNWMGKGTSSSTTSSQNSVMQATNV